MATNPYDDDSYKRNLWESGASAAKQNYNEHFAKAADDITDAWWRGYATVIRERLGAECVDDRFLAGFDQGLEAAQEHGVAGDGRDWKEIATHLLSQVIDLRLLAKWQANPDDAAENAVAYARAGFRSHIDLARRRLADLPTPEDTP